MSGGVSGSLHNGPDTAVVELQLRAPVAGESGPAAAGACRPYTHTHAHTCSSCGT